MTDNRCCCQRCLHSSCPLPHAQPPYDELVHEIDNNFVSVRIPKFEGKFEQEDAWGQPKNLSFDFNCADAEGTSSFPSAFRLPSRVLLAFLGYLSAASPTNGE